MNDLNALHNLTNPFQTNTKKVLCVCSAGLLRSPTAANVLHQEFGFNTRAAGLMESFALIPVSKLLLYWADEIVVMEPWQGVEVKEIMTLHNLDKPIKVLNVPDAFEWNDTVLRGLIKEAYIKGSRK